VETGAKLNTIDYFQTYLILIDQPREEEEIRPKELKKLTARI